MRAKCKILGCDKLKKNGRSMCSKHSNQWDRHGRILERTKYDPNEIVIYESYADVILYNENCEEIARAQIDLFNISLISDHKWCKSSTTGYAVTTINGKQTGMHNLIMDHSDLLKPIDHDDRNKLNNRRSNLKISTHSDNAKNSDKYDEYLSAI